MPVHKIPGDYKYGQTWKKYYGKDAKKKAKRQELAIRLSGYKEPKKKMLSHDDDAETIGRLFIEKFFRKETGNGN